MKKLCHIIFLLVNVFFIAETFALPAIDNTCKNCERRYLDSMNVYDRRPIRVNQVGFRPQDLHKYAYAADYPANTKFKVIDATSGSNVYEGSITVLRGPGGGSVVKPNIWVNGAFNSITSVYEFGSSDSLSSSTETLYRADFSSLATPGQYFIVIGSDTSATFLIHDEIFNSIFETSLKFFGIQRCGDTKSQLHGTCHLKDGSAVNHDLTGGWHDCGDHFKVSQTLGYAAYVLAMAYNVYADKAEDRYGNSYNDTVSTDGIPDILYEAKTGADFIYKLYKASRADGLIDKGDMYHSVGVSSADHQFWDVPEKQDAQSQAKGGPDRPVAKGIGTNTAGMFAGALAYFAAGWKAYDPTYADSLVEAAKDIYAKVLKPGYGTNTSELGGFYTGGGPLYDDAAAAALALWYVTKDTSYAYDLYKNTTINDNADNYKYNLPYFRGGYMGHRSGFYPGGWMTDYENVHSYVLFSFAKLILPTAAKAQSYGIDAAERDTLLNRIVATFTRLTDDGTQGDSTVSTNPYGSFRVTPPYNLVWTSSDWGFNRYNMGAANAVFMLYDITGDEKYLNVALDNIYYNMGANPWDLSFLMGAGEKNENHPHNRAANPDGYNAGGMPYKYKCPRGALMGGSAPTKTLKDDWNDYTATETCIDFSTQFIIPALSLSKDLPIDEEGPLFSNVTATPISETSAIISWSTNELARVTVYYNTTNDVSGILSVSVDTLTKNGSVTLTGLTAGVTYYFFLEGKDVKSNISTDDNHGQWYSFTMTSTVTQISGVTICQVDHRSAKIYWWTKEAASNTLVKYGTATAALTETAIGEAGYFHTVTLTGLSPSTKYYFDVSSGATTDDNGGNHYSFTTTSQAAYANFEIYIKPSSYQSACSDWKTCNTLIISVINNDTIAYTNAELRLYLKTNNLNPVSYISSVWDGTGTSAASGNIVFGTPIADGTGAGYYLPITLTGTFAVSGKYLFQLKFQNATFADLEGSWSLRAHTQSTDPEQFSGIDLTKAPYYTGSETTELEKNADGVTEKAFTLDPYVAIYYNGIHIYGYDPGYDATSSDLTLSRNVTLNFTSPFVTPIASVEQTTYPVNYAGESAVSPTGYLDALEANGDNRPFAYSVNGRYDAFLFSIDTTLAYGNNRIDWVSWHNRNANTTGSYDCACAVVRSNVEIDTITTPLEKRYLIFTPSDSVFAYEGKMGSVHVKLVDSTGTIMLGEDISVALSVAEGNVLFWTSPTATISVTSITLVNGEATFYFSSTAAVSTILTGRASGGKATLSYSPATVKLVIQELPPWPIIDNAKMLDTDCDLIPDAIQVTLSNPYQEGQSFTRLDFVYNGDTLSSTDGTVVDKILTVKFSTGDTIQHSTPSGAVTLVSLISGAEQVHSDYYTDGVSPTLVSISVLEHLDTVTTDKVYLQFSEPISAPGIDWPLVLYSANDVQQATVPTVIKSKLYNEEKNIWEFEIAIPASGTSLVQEGMKGQLAATATITDKSGNGVSPCSQKMLPITLKLVLVAMNYASIADGNGDGLAENVTILFSRSVDALHAPDQVSVIFGSAEPETLWTKAYTWNADRTSATLDLAKPFKLGNTNGTYSGSYQGKTLIGAGLVTQHKGEGANYESNSTIAEDLTGPVIISGEVTPGTAVNGLMAYASEPLLVKDSTLDLLQRERKGPIAIDAYDWILMNDNSNINIYFLDDSQGAVGEGDRIRFAPLTSIFTDKSGNIPSMENPWATVTGDGKPIIDFSFHLKDHVSEVSSSAENTVLPVTKNETYRLLILNQATGKYDWIENGVVKASADTANYPFTGAVFELTLGVPRGAAYNEAPAWDSLQVSYEIPVFTNLGNFVNSIKGKFTLTDPYVSSNNEAFVFIEWVARPKQGLASASGKAVGTGAYIAKATLKTRFYAAKSDDLETMKRFSTSSDYDATRVFGIQRIR